MPRRARPYRARQRGFPTAVRGSAASVGATVDWVANFAIIEIFPALESGIGLA